MKKRRSDCPLSCWLDLFGDRWTLLIIRDVVAFGKTNFKEFIASNEGISTNILANRLKRLEAHGIVTKTQSADNRRMFNYQITEKGLQMAPIFREIAKWSNQHVEGTLKVF